MGEKELRLALVCYGGVSLAVYMHGVTKEIWHLARASRDFADNAPAADAADCPSQHVYRDILDIARRQLGLDLRVVPDIISGASAGGINGVFLAHALETGQSLDPLTNLWLEGADAEILIDPDARPLSRFTKFWARPLLWLLMRHRGDTVERTVAPETRREVRRKLSNFVRARWFAPPFGGEGFSALLLDAFDAMAAGKAGKPLIPDGQPLDLFVTATDFSGHDERLLLNSPPQITETEHRLSISFHARGRAPRTFGSPAELVFAARATASFPGAFPPFTVRELDRVLQARNRGWPERTAFLKRLFPSQSAQGTAEETVLIDGSVLANAPFAQAIGALKDRPARRIVDRRFVYIQPTPGHGRYRLTAQGPLDAAGHVRLPGFFRTVFGALSDLPRAQPIRDNLDAIAERSQRIATMREIMASLRPAISQVVATRLGDTLAATTLTTDNMLAWRAEMQREASCASGFAYAAYAQLKRATIITELADILCPLAGPDADVRALTQTLSQVLKDAGVDLADQGADDGANPALIQFFRDHDVAFRIRRLRFLARELVPLAAQDRGSGQEGERAREAIRDLCYLFIARYAACQQLDILGETQAEMAQMLRQTPLQALAHLADRRDLRTTDQAFDEQFVGALGALSAEAGRSLLQAYLGFPFFDIASLPLLQGEGLDEYDPIKVDRISPDDAVAIRKGGAQATLRGIEFNSFGAFFSRAYRENDYLWGRLHGADRLIDLLYSTMDKADGREMPSKERWKRRIFHAILDEEVSRLGAVQALIASLRTEIDQAIPPV